MMQKEACIGFSMVRWVKKGMCSNILIANTVDNRLYKEMPEPKKKKTKPKKKPARKGRAGVRRSSRRAAQTTAQEEEEAEEETEDWVPWQLVCVCENKTSLTCLLTCYCLFIVVRHQPRMGSVSKAI